MLCFSASGFSRVSFSPHTDDLATVEETFGPGEFQASIRGSFPSAMCFWGEKRGQGSMACPAPTCVSLSASLGIQEMQQYPSWPCRDFQGEEEIPLCSLSPSKKGSSNLCREPASAGCLFMGIPPYLKRVQRSVGFPSSFLVCNFSRKVATYIGFLLPCVFLKDFWNVLLMRFL